MEQKGGSEGGREGGREGGKAYLGGLDGNGELLEVGLLVVHEQDVGNGLQVGHLYISEA